MRVGSSRSRRNKTIHYIRFSARGDQKRGRILANSRFLNKAMTAERGVPARIGYRRPVLNSSLTTYPALKRPDLLATPVESALRAWTGPVDVEQVMVAEIDPELADTETFCSRYHVSLKETTNCVIVVARRGGETTLAACVVLAVTRVDVNGLVRRHLGARKVSFAPTNTAVEETGMEYGGITPLGLPADWQILVDQAVVETDTVVTGSGIRRSKLWMPGRALAALAGAEILDGLGLGLRDPAGPEM
jgi:prolyl-tRNA editing enzyme YbaK/EbsC (Cys-tRNA(Pro) deacylase)